MSERPCKRRLGLSVRALMVLVGVVAVVIGWRVNRARDQRLAVAAIRAKGGYIDYDFTTHPKPGQFPRLAPDAPEWLREALGDEYFQEVTAVTLPERDWVAFLPHLATFDHLDSVMLNVSEEDEASLAELVKHPSLWELTIIRPSDVGLANLVGGRHLRKLQLHGAAKVTNAGMASLSALHELEELRITGGAPKVTGVGLKNLGSRLAELEVLALHGTGLTDEGMACLEVCRKLKDFTFRRARVGDAGFAHLRAMESLEVLDAESTGVTDEGLAALRGLRRLVRVSLAETRITGPGLNHLEGLDRLESLDLRQTDLTDEGLGPIRKLKGLVSLDLYGTKVTAQGVAALEAAMPSLQINHPSAALLWPSVPAPPPLP